MTMNYEAICAFLYREARFLDDQDWDNWLAMYDVNATYWVPAWDDNGELTEDPQTEISLIWYGRRAGLEDRVFRIRTERSSATIPDTRTTHLLSNVEVLEQGDTVIKTRHNFHTMSVRYNHIDHFCGTTFT
ncbi:MAG: benzoate 1,2-dioxygenase small subunit, partial [Thauera phenolivorans]|nr:benzoate 1,2-dioxygenase small subunit [Thauera phenolivorans]